MIVYDDNNSPYNKVLSPLANFIQSYLLVCYYQFDG